EPKIGIMTSGVSNIIFASGERISDRRPPNAMAETGSDKPGRRASTMSVFRSLGLATGVDTSGDLPFLFVNAPWYRPSVAVYARRRLPTPLNASPQSPRPDGP